MKLRAPPTAGSCNHRAAEILYASKQQEAIRGLPLQSALRIKKGPKAAESNILILSVDVVVNPDACEGANLDLGAGVDGEVDVLGAEGVRARVGCERARLRLVERAARRRAGRGRLRDVVVLVRHGEDLRGGGLVSISRTPVLGSAAATATVVGWPSS